MSFFDREPGDVGWSTAPAPTSDPPWLHAPTDELPVVLPVSAAVTRSRNAVLLLSDVRVYSVGVALTVTGKVRSAGLDDQQWDDLVDRVRGFGRRRRSGSSRTVQFGVELADGTRVTVDQEPPFDGDAPDRPRLTSAGSSGTGSSDLWESTWQFWLWPLPPDGPLRVVMAWPQLALDESSTVVDCGDLRALSARVQTLWPD